LRRCWTGVVPAAVLASLVIPVAGSAQAKAREGGRGWFPREAPFERLIAAPREVQFRGAFVLADRNVAPGFEGRNIEAIVAIGQNVGVYRFDDNEGIDGAITLHMEFGIFSRFFMEEPTRDLINADFRIGLPLQFRRGPWQLRVGYRHLSSHIGDDYLNRFPESVLQTSKDGFVGDVAYRLNEAVRVYGGADYNFHTNAFMSRASLRGGFEFDAIPAGEEDSVWPFLAADAEYFSYSDDVAINVTGGIGFRVRGRLMRVEGRGHLGPSAMAQFREIPETFLGLGIRIDI
jgi:Protein of unknown function (DUF1207)